MNESKTVRLEANRLRRIALTLGRWSVEQCNGTIQRDGEDGDGKPFRVVAGNFGFGWQENRYPIPDRERGARKQLDAIMEAHPTLWHYIQGDPRGCPLYVGKKADLKSTNNEIVRKAQSWGAHIWNMNTGTPAFAVKHGVDLAQDLPGTFDTEEAAARAYLKSRGATIPARDLLPVDQYYNVRGVAVSV